MFESTKRRNFLKLGLGSVGAFIAGMPAAKALGEACGLTPPQTSGPFYPGESNFQHNHDLTRVPGHTSSALGQVIYIFGSVLDEECKPVAAANVEIWQACASGKYNNPKDDNPAPLDPNFRYWGETQTNQNGSYFFKSIIPGAYPADTNWTRPPHIHFKVAKLGYHELVTQMYFQGNPLNDNDLILQAIPEAERKSVIVAFEPSTPGSVMGRENSLTGKFDITIRRVRR